MSLLFPSGSNETFPVSPLYVFYKKTAKVENRMNRILLKNALFVKHIETSILTWTLMVQLLARLTGDQEVPGLNRGQSLTIVKNQLVYSKSIKCFFTYYFHYIDEGLPIIPSVSPVTL